MAHVITIEPLGIEISCEEDQRLLTAMLEQGVKVKNLCRSGRCGMCKSQILDGEVDYGDASSHTLFESEREQGKVLLCTATPLSDVIIEVEESIL